MSNFDGVPLKDMLWGRVVSAPGAAHTVLLDRESAISIATVVRKLGYRKPRTIRTLKGLDALPNGAIIRCGGVTYEHHDGWFRGVDGSNVTAELISLPAVVLWEPEAEVGAWSA